MQTLVQHPSDESLPQQSTTQHITPFSLFRLPDSVLDYVIFLAASPEAERSWPARMSLRNALPLIKNETAEVVAGVLFFSRAVFT